jgi:hypothetical protein
MADSFHANTERGKELLCDVDGLNRQPISGSVLYNIETIFWADGFAPSNYSSASVHVCLVTIGVPEGDHTGPNTFILWLGPSKTSTRSVEKLPAAELNLLRKGLDSTGKPFLVYHKPSQRLVHVRVCLYAFLCDKIDKAKRTQMLQGGMYHLRHGYMGNFNRDINSIIPYK